MTGKQKCKILRQIRRDIAEANQLDGVFVADFERVDFVLVQFVYNVACW